MPYAYRPLTLGDVKDEYEPLCRALGVEPHAVGHGLPARINPLDYGPLGNDWSALPRAEVERRGAMVFSRWLILIKGLVGSQHVPFDPTAETAVGQVIRDLTGYTAGADRMREITIPQVWDALNNPIEALVRECRYSDRQHFLDETRPVRDALGSLVKGHLAGLFDAPTTVDADWRAPIQSLSLSRLDPLGDEAVGVALTCLNSWGRAMTQVAEPGDLRIIIRDECWKQMRLGVDAVKSLDADLRLSRRDGAIQAVIAHKPSDMYTVGDAGSQAVAIAKDLMHLCATKVLLGQDDALEGLDLGVVGHHVAQLPAAAETDGQRDAGDDGVGRPAGDDLGDEGFHQSAIALAKNTSAAQARPPRTITPRNTQPRTSRMVCSIRAPFPSARR